VITDPPGGETGVGNSVEEKLPVELNVNAYATTITIV
jgi:hypothetical protein